MGRLIDADVLKIDISRLHALNDEAKIRRAYELNPHSTTTDFEDTLVSVFDAIDAQPTIEVPKWIPCSERLPSENVEVLVCDKDGTMEVCDREYFDRGRGILWTDKNGEECWLDVVAWMPLPEPWKGADDE